MYAAEKKRFTHLYDSYSAFWCMCTMFAFKPPKNTLPSAKHGSGNIMLGCFSVSRAKEVRRKMNLTK